jgi:hypothetical protein
MWEMDSLCGSALGALFLPAIACLPTAVILSRVEKGERMRMKKAFGVLFFCLCLAVVSASAQRDYCFHNDGLKVKQTVSLTIKGNKIEGTFESSGYDENTSAETFDFTGTKTGNLLTIKFEGKAPYELPPGTKRIVWTLGARTLRIPTYGKNYNTRKYSTYGATYQKCRQNQ